MKRSASASGPGARHARCSTSTVRRTRRARPHPLRGSNRRRPQHPPNCRRKSKPTVFLLQVETAIQEQDFQGAKTTIDRILELQAEHDLELPEQFSFQYAQVLERLGLYDEAMETVTRYLTRVGRAGEFYREALALLNDAESAKATAIEAAAEAARRPAGETRVFDGMEFVWVPAGEFRMGSTSSEASDREQPVTQVRISRGFWLGKHEVTQAEWQGGDGEQSVLPRRVRPELSGGTGFLE